MGYVVTVLTVTAEHQVRAGIRAVTGVADVGRRRSAAADGAPGIAQQNIDHTIPPTVRSIEHVNQSPGMFCLLSHPRRVV